MFNFFYEIKKSIKEKDFLKKYNMVNISGQILYVEGHQGVTFISKQRISFKVKNARITVDGEDLNLLELSDDTLKISGKITKTEEF